MVGLMLLPAETTKKPDANTEMRALRQQIEQLQSRFKTIGDRLTKLEAVRSRAVSRIEVLPYPPGASPPVVVPSQPGVPNRSGQPPKIWGQGEINGWPYYLIPCGWN
jgi:hypothetical protein